MTDKKEWQLCPPSLDRNLWSKIPDDRKQDFFSHAARQLTRGFHPNVTARAYLIDIGLLSPPSVPPKVSLPNPFALKRDSRSPKLQSATPVPVAAKIGKGFKVKTVVQDEDESEFVFTIQRTRANLSVLKNTFSDDAEAHFHQPLRFTLPSDAKPLGDIGLAVHDLLGLAGEAGQQAAEVEASILAAIALDPVRVAADPLYVISLGAVAPDFVIQAISQLIVEDVHRRFGIDAGDSDYHATDFEIEEVSDNDEYTVDQQWVDNE